MSHSETRDQCSDLRLCEQQAGSVPRLPRNPSQQSGCTHVPGYAVSAAGQPSTPKAEAAHPDTILLLWPPGRSPGARPAKGSVEGLPRRRARPLGGCEVCAQQRDACSHRPCQACNLHRPCPLSCTLCTYAVHVTHVTAKQHGVCGGGRHTMELKLPQSQPAGAHLCTGSFSRGHRAAGGSR